MLSVTRISYMASSIEKDLPVHLAEERTSESEQAGTHRSSQDSGGNDADGVAPGAAKEGHAHRSRDESGEMAPCAGNLASQDEENGMVDREAGQPAREAPDPGLEVEVAAQAATEKELDVRCEPPAQPVEAEREPESVVQSLSLRG